MTVCDQIRLELGGYALGALEPAEETAVRQHLASCHACAAEHARLADLPDLLTLAEGLDEAEAPAPALEERVLDAFALEHARPPAGAPWWRRGLPRLRVLVPVSAAFAILVVALVLALTAGGPGHTGYDVALRPAAGQAARGRVELSSVPGGTSVQMWVRNLPADPNVVYEVRCDAPGWSASAGTFRVDTQGRAYVVLTTAARRGEYDAIRLVRHSKAGTTDVMSAQLN